MKSAISNVSFKPGHHSVRHKFCQCGIGGPPWLRCPIPRHSASAYCPLTTVQILYGLTRDGQTGRPTDSYAARLVSWYDTGSLLRLGRVDQDEIVVVRHLHLRQRLRIHHVLGSDDAVEVQEVR